MTSYSNVIKTMRLKVTHPPFKHQFRPISAHSASTVIVGKNVQLVLIGCRPRAFQQAKNELCTLPLSLPMGGTRQFLLL